MCEREMREIKEKAERRDIMNEKDVIEMRNRDRSLKIKT